MSLLSEVAFTFNGSATDETVGTVTRAMHGPLVAPTAPITPVVEAMFESVYLQTGTPVVGSVEGQFCIIGQTSVTTSVANAVRELADDWRLLAARYSPFLGAVTLAASRKASGGATVTSNLTVRVLDLPTIQVLDAGSNLIEPDQAGIYLTPAIAAIRSFYVVRFRADYGLWRGAAEDDTQTATTGGATLTTTNSGIRDVGCRVDIGATTGSPTQLTIATGGVTYVTITNPTNGTYVDFSYATPGEYPTPTATVVVPSTMRVPAGATAWTVTVSGGTGTVAVTVTWKPEFPSW